MDTMRDEWLQTMLKTGIAGSYEIRAMAHELIERRKGNVAITDASSYRGFPDSFSLILTPNYMSFKFATRDWFLNWTVEDVPSALRFTRKDLTP